MDRSVTALIAARTLDGELGALLWLLIEAGVPIVVAGPRDSGRTTVLTALLEFLPPDAPTIPLAGVDEDFAAMPEAVELGWRREARSPVPVSRSAGTVLLAEELADRPPLGVWGERALIVVRALSVGYGLATTIEADGLDEAFALLRGPEVGAGSDELAALGIVLVLEERTADAPPSVTVAHYVRPIARDPQGHVQRLPPAVLSARDARTGRLEHFWWGISDELAGRTGRRPIQLEREQARRAGLLARMAAAGIVDPAEVRGAIAAWRADAGSRLDAGS